MTGFETALRASQPAIRIGNCSRLLRRPALRDAGDARGWRRAELDVLTGDYLAELTMLILGKDHLKDPSLGYARTFVRQVEDCLGLALEQGVRIVANAGGLNPAGLADRLREVARGLGLDPAIAYVDGDNLSRHRPRLPGRADRQRLPRRLRHRPRARAGRRHRRHRPGHRRLARRRTRRRAPRLGPRRRTTSWPAPSSPGTSSSAAPRPPAATSRASARSPRRDRRWASRSPRSPPTGRRVITKHAGTGGRSPSTRSPRSWSTRSRPTHYLGPDVTVAPRHDRARAGRRGPGRGLRRPRPGTAARS